MSSRARYRLYTPHKGKEGELIVPIYLTAEEVEMIWQQIQAVYVVMKTRIVPPPAAEEPPDEPA